MSRRSRAREIALQLLYQEDINADQAEDVRLRFLHGRLQYNRKLIKFAQSLIDGVQQHRETIDRALELTARNWRLSRMAATDRNVLRLGAFEILFGDTPDRVAVNEAIELAKRYGTNNSAQFVNGVLDRLMKSKTNLYPPKFSSRSISATSNQATVTLKHFPILVDPASPHAYRSDFHEITKPCYALESIQTKQRRRICQADPRWAPAATCQRRIPHRCFRPFQIGDAQNRHDAQHGHSRLGQRRPRCR